MKIIENWSNFNIKNKLTAEDFVKNNLKRLIQLFNIEDDLTIEEKESILIEYLTKYPDQIKNLSFRFPQQDRQSIIPVIQNIGGTIKYR